jgi:hypothetical protein
MGHRDENDLTDAEVRAMWDEGEPAALAVSVFDVDPSPWVVEPSNTAPRGFLGKAITYYSFFGAGRVRYPFRMSDTGMRSEVE